PRSSTAPSSTTWSASASTRPSSAAAPCTPTTACTRAVRPAACTRRSAGTSPSTRRPPGSGPPPSSSAPTAASPTRRPSTTPPGWSAPSARTRWPPPPPDPPRPPHPTEGTTVSDRLPPPPPSLTLLSEHAAAAQIEGHREDCLDLVRRAYLTHDGGDSVNPQSGFLRFPDQPRARIISLPAYLGGEFGVAGLKWIASFPDNPRTHGIPRASAVLLLNDVVTGYPAACLESSVISATRTAASAVLAAETLSGGRTARRVGVVGTGLIARHVWTFLRDLKWDIGGFTLHDLNPEAAHAFGAELVAEGAPGYTVADDAEQA